METTFGGFINHTSSAKKKRTTSSRRPRHDALQSSFDFPDISSLSSTPPSDINLIHYEEEGGFGESDEASIDDSRNDQRFTEGAFAPPNWDITNKLGQSVSDTAGNETRLKKVKLKVGGVTRTLNAKSTLDDSSNIGSSTKSSRLSDSLRPWQKFTDNSDDNPSSASDKGGSLYGLERRDFYKNSIPIAKLDPSMGRMPHKSISLNNMEKHEPVHKRNPASNRRSSSRAIDDGSDDDDEIRYLEKAKTLKVRKSYGPNFDDDVEVGNRKQRQLSKVLDRNIDSGHVGDYGSLRSSRQSKRLRSGTIVDDNDYLAEEEPVSDDEPKISRRKEVKRESVNLQAEKVTTITTRQRALQTVASVVEFPNGLPPAPPRKPKEILTEVEQQLKKSEAAQRRRMQMEKAARENEAEAIRKILGQDSTRKKREAKIKQRQEEIAEEKEANSKILPSDTVRWVIGPSGTVVTFPSELGLPSIFNPKPCSYPPPREKCAGPSCTNPYKYRDSKSKLPLCSLQCYKAVQGKMSPLTAC
ncbi:hypothetical protein ACFE04_028351 [Oxalis oulophora]